MAIKADRHPDKPKTTLAGPDHPKPDFKRLDFKRLAGFAMIRMGWSAEAFWAATPADFMMALDALDPHIRAMSDAVAGSFLDHHDLDRLMQRFPDQAVDAGWIKTS